LNLVIFASIFSVCHEIPFSRALRQLHEFTSSFDSITELSVSFSLWLARVITLVLVLRHSIKPPLCQWI